MEEKNKLKKNKLKNGIKKTLAIGISGALALSVLIPAGWHALKGEKNIDESILNPPPIVMEIDEELPQEETSEQEKEKMGLRKRLKLALYGFFSAIGLWFAKKIPWKKIFNKKNLIILLVLIGVGLAVYFILPEVWEDCPWN